MRRVGATILLRRSQSCDFLLAFLEEFRARLTYLGIIRVCPFEVCIQAALIVWRRDFVSVAQSQVVGGFVLLPSQEMSLDLSAMFNDRVF